MSTACLTEHTYLLISVFLHWFAVATQSFEVFSLGNFSAPGNRCWLLSVFFLFRWQIQDAKIMVCPPFHFYHSWNAERTLWFSHRSTLLSTIHAIRSHHFCFYWKSRLNCRYKWKLHRSTMLFKLFETSPASRTLMMAGVCSMSRETLSNQPFSIRNTNTFRRLCRALWASALSRLASSGWYLDRNLCPELGVHNRLGREWWGLGWAGSKS